MKAHIVASRRADYQCDWGAAFLAGLRSHGIQAEISERPEPADLQVFWGVRKQEAIKAQLAAGGEVCILERAYLGDRFAWCSVSFGGGLNGRGRFYGPFHDGSRWDRHFAHLLQPWRSRPHGYALILGQVPTDMSLQGINPTAIWRKTADRLIEAGYRVKLRPHPQAPYVGLHGVEIAGGSLSQAFEGAALAVGINSNSTVESVLAGVPTITLDDRAMAWPVTGHDVREIITPVREAWAQRLAWCQYSLEEIRSGYCWECVGGGIAKS